MKFYETKKRSFVKGVSWKIIGGIITAIIVYYLASLGYDAAKTASIVLVCQFSINVVAFFIHDRVWNRFNWGREIIEDEIPTKIAV
jgi:uncharacterized membrane protein